MSARTRFLAVDCRKLTNDKMEEKHAMSKKAAKTTPTLIKVGPAQEIYYASRGFAGRGWYVREYHSVVAMKKVKAGEWGASSYVDDGPFATKEEAVGYVFDHCLQGTPEGRP
jgi:hypothetical protein